MSKYYFPRRKKNLFDPASSEPFSVSRSKIDLFLECPRCFYLDRRLGIARPPGYPFALNSAVDALLKKEFDAHRAARSRHPLMEQYGIDAVPFEHKEFNAWRDNFKGVRHLHQPTNLLVTGAIDDVWINSKKELMVVDYKSTAKDGEVNIDAEWQISYKRQMEIYQWLLRRNGFEVCKTGYFVYCNGKTDRKAFDKKIEFDVILLPYAGDDQWVEPTLYEIKKCLTQEKIPAMKNDCDYCRYRKEATSEEEKDFS